MKIVLSANTDWYLYNFRLSLVQELTRRGHEVLLISPAGRYGEKLLAMGYRWLAIPMDRRSLNPFKELYLLLWMKALFKREKVDLIHGMTIKSAVYGALAARLAGVHARVLAVTGMGYVFTSNHFRARALRPVLRSLFKIALAGSGTRLILQNADDVALFQAAGLYDPAKVRVIPGSGVNCERFRPPADRQERGELRVLLAARLVRDKGVVEFVKAALQLRREGRQLTFLLAGAPDPGNPSSIDQGELEDWARQGAVTWLGHVDDMEGLLATIDIMVLPSYREGLPKGLIEAAACGIALVTTDVPGCREVVTDEVDGLLIPVRDSGAIARAVARLQDDFQLRMRLGEAARKKVAEVFNENIIIGSTIAVYEEIFPG